MKKISNLFVLIAMILLLNATSIFASRNMEITEMTKSYESPSVYAVSPVNAGMTDDRGKTIQITSKNRVMGFAEDRIYIVGEGYFFMEHFGGTKGVTPQRSGEDKIVYTDLWARYHFELRKTTGRAC